MSSILRSIGFVVTALGLALLPRAIAEGHVVPGGQPGDIRQPVVLLEYPVGPDQFQADIRPLVPQIIAAHGLEEWKAAVLTNELHRHLGVYSIVGAKMGILARELLEAPFDGLVVETHAGLAPPLSCINDGLQVATGASLGRGTISVAGTAPALPEAIFYYNGRELCLRLKDAIRSRIEADFRAAAGRYGSQSPEYFGEVRRLSLRLWLDLRRQEIFEQVDAASTAAPRDGSSTR